MKISVFLLVSHHYIEFDRLGGEERAFSLSFIAFVTCLSRSLCMHVPMNVRMSPGALRMCEVMELVCSNIDISPVRVRR
jgi:hypothetical protein